MWLAPRASRFLTPMRFTLASSTLSPKWKPALAFRLGLWIEPEHRIRARGVGLLTVAILRAGESQLHYSAGVGVAFQSFQLRLRLGFLRSRQHGFLIRDSQFLMSRVDVSTPAKTPSVA